MGNGLKNIFVKLHYWTNKLYPQCKRNGPTFKEGIIRKKFRKKDGQKYYQKR